MSKVILVIAALILVANAELKSPCDNFFKYTSIGTDEWQGELTLKTDYTLHGLWVRIFLNSVTPDTVFHVKGNFGDVIYSKDEPGAYLVKDRNFVLHKNKPEIIRFTVQYPANASTVPEFAGFRLNARTMCPEGQD